MKLHAAHEAMSVMDQVKSVLNIAATIERIVPPDIAGFRIMAAIATDPKRVSAAAESLLQIFGEQVYLGPAFKEGFEVALYRFPVRISAEEARTLLRYYGFGPGTIQDANKARSEAPMNLVRSDPIVALGSERFPDYEWECRVTSGFGVMTWTRALDGFSHQHLFAGVREITEDSEY